MRDIGCQNGLRHYLADRKPYQALRMQRQMPLVFLVALSAICGSSWLLKPYHQKLYPIEQEEFALNEDSFQRYLDIKISKELSRGLSKNLGGGQCEWTNPEFPEEDAVLFGTAIVAYPGSGKRIAFLQMEGMTGIKAGDDYDLSGVHAMKGFMKTSFPHHEGIWSWGKNMNQSVIVLRNPLHAIVSYHNLLYEIGYAKDWWTAYSFEHRVFTLRPPVYAWENWRDRHFDDEIHWWGWVIDFWMERGMLRDIRTHQPCNATWWNAISLSHEHKYPDLEGYVPPAEPLYHPRCQQGDMDDCRPVAAVSYEKLTSMQSGPEETGKLMAALNDKTGMDVIEEEAQPCVWRELIVKGMGGRLNSNRNGKGPAKEAFVYTPEQLQKMKEVIEIYIAKYSSGIWVDNQVAQDMVGYMNTYLVEVDAVIGSPQSGGSQGKGNGSNPSLRHLEEQPKGAIIHQQAMELNSATAQEQIVAGIPH